MKASVLFGAGWENDSLEVLWRDAGHVFCGLYRNDTEGERHAFMPVPAGVEHPTLGSINRLTHELKNNLDCTRALRPLGLLRERGQTMLVVNYTSGEPLDLLVQQPMEMGQFLRLFVVLPAAISQLHGLERHKDSRI